MEKAKNNLNFIGTLRGAFLMQFFLQRARHQHMYTLRMDSLYASVSAPHFGVAAIGCHYGAGRTVIKINERR